jgi:hypothetical protein
MFLAAASASASFAVGFSAPGVRQAPAVALPAVLRRPRRHAAPSATLHSPFPSPDLPLPGGAASESSITDVQSSSWPVRVMVFIDGSWLYYSFHGRRPGCPVHRAYGNGWQYNYRLLFDRLPHLIANHLHQQLLLRHRVNRFVEARRRPRPRRRRRAPPPPPRAAAIRRRARRRPRHRARHRPRPRRRRPRPPPTRRALSSDTQVARTVVFTSARADTARQSTRMTMFREMEEANFEVRARAEGGGHPSARRGRPPSEGGGHPRPGGQHQRRPDAEGPPPPGSVSTPPRAPLPAACRCT